MNNAKAQNEVDNWLKNQATKPGFQLAFDTGYVKITFVDEIRRVMRARKITRATLARKLGWKPPRLTKALSGEENLTIKTMVALAHALDYELSFYLLRKVR